MRDNIPESVIVDALTATRGTVSLAAKSLNMSYYWLYKRINASPALGALLIDLRTSYDKQQIEKHEAVLDWINERVEEYPSIAVTAALRYLDSTKFRHAPDARQGQAASKLDDITSGIATRAADIGDYDT